MRIINSTNQQTYNFDRNFYIKPKWRNMKKYSHTENTKNPFQPKIELERQRSISQPLSQSRSSSLTTLKTRPPTKKNNRQNPRHTTASKTKKSQRKKSSQIQILSLRKNGNWRQISHNYTQTDINLL